MTLSDADVGLATEMLPANTQAGMSDAQVGLSDNITSMLEGAKRDNVLQFVKDVGKRLATGTVAAADMVLGLPGQALGVGANLGARAAALGSGESRRVQGLAGEQAQEELVPEALKAPLSYLVKKFANVEEYDQTSVAKTIEGMARKVEQATKGAVSAEDAKAYFNTAMLGLGARGTDIGIAEAVKAKPARGMQNRATYTEPAAKPAAKAGEPDIQFIETPGQVKEIFQKAKGKNQAERDSRTVREFFEEAMKPQPAKDVIPPNPDEIGKMVGKTEKTTTGEEIIIGEEAAPRETTPIVDHRGEPVDAALTSGLDKIRNDRGFEVTAEEKIALNAARMNSERLMAGPNKLQRGSADWKNLASVFVATGAGTALGLWGYRWYDQWQKQQEQDQQDYNKTKDEEPQENENGNLNADSWKHILPVAVAAGAIKMKGGMWHPEAVARLATPLAEQLSGKPRHILDDITENRRNNEGIRPEYLEAEAQHKWSEKAISNYLNKHAGTATDPLKDVEIPFGEGTAKWENIWEDAADSRAAINYSREPGFEKAKPEELIWNITQQPPVNKAGRAFRALDDYMSHVGDYLRQNVKSDKLAQYDLVRAVKETAENDKRVAKEMEKAQASSTKDLPVYKEYPDGYKWVELKLPEKLTEEQAKQVRKATKQELAGRYLEEFNEAKAPIVYIAQDAAGKPIKNSYTEDIAGGKTLEEAWLAGRLAEEGNTLGHCVGGYCDAVASGESKIYSLRDEKGKSHVTIEVQPEGNYGGGAAPLQEIKDPHILQIKGKQNRAPASQYLPYVQDFVRGGKWGEVGDLGNTGLLSQKDVGPATWKALQDKFGESQYYDKDQLANIDILGAARKGEQGNVDPKLLASLATIGGGAALGAYLNPDHPFKAGLYGAGVGLLLANVKPKAWVEAIKRAQIPDKIVKIENYIRDRVYAEKVGDRATYQLTDRIQREIPSQSRREAIYDFLENERPVTLTPAEHAVANDVRQFLNGLGELARDSKVIREMIDDYATRIYGGGKTGLFGEKKVGGNTSVSSPFGKPRGYQTRAEAEAAGLTPVTTDIAQVVDLYSKSVRSAIENRKLIDTLRQAQLEDGTKLLVKTNKGKRAPDNYVSIDHPQMEGWAVHPDIAPDLRFVFDNKNFGSIVGALDAINTTQKRLGVSMSLFHATALEHAMIGGTSILKSPARGARILAQSFAPAIFGENLTVRMVREGGTGDLVDSALKDGVQISFERQGPTVAEERMPLYKAMDSATKFLNETVPHLGDITTGAVAKLNHMFDRAMWGRFHAALKLETYADKVADLQRNNARDVANGKADLKSRDEIGRTAASFVNDLYGGLDWYKLVTEFDSRWGREVASAVFSPSGRLGQRMVAFAPDWTISTTRAFAKSFGPAALAGVAGGIAGSEISEDNKLVGGALGILAGFGAGKAAGLKLQTGSSWKGVMPSWMGESFGPRELADLHRQYFLRSAIIYTGIVDAVNFQLSGHHIWDNKDPTRLDLGDGRTMQVSKHFMEPIHWLVTPRQQALNKLSYIVKEPASQIMDQEYLSTKGAPRMGNTPRDKEISLGTRVEHAAKGFAPISAGQMAGQGAAAGVMGFAGMPIYGKTYEERDRLKQERKEQNIQRRIDRRQRRQEQGR